MRETLRRCAANAYQGRFVEPQYRNVRDTSVNFCVSRGRVAAEAVVAAAAAAAAIVPAVSAASALDGRARKR